MFCMKCGKEIQEGTAFCAHCGTAAGTPPQASVRPAAQTKSEVLPGNLVGEKAQRSYTFSIIGAIIALLIRIGLQDVWWHHDSWFEYGKVLGIERDLKPVLTFVPGIAAVIVTLLVLSDRITSTQNKVIVLVKNAVILLLAVLFIWLDIPYRLIDF